MSYDQKRPEHKSTKRTVGKFYGPEYTFLKNITSQSSRLYSGLLLPIRTDKFYGQSKQDRDRKKNNATYEFYQKEVTTNYFDVRLCVFVSVCVIIMYV